MSLRIGIFGGMFDPIHDGHLRIADRAQEDLRLDRVVFLPIGNPGHRTSPTRYAAAKRFTMVSRAIDIRKPRWAMDDWSVLRRGKTFMVDYLKEFRAIHPLDSVFLILGEDEVRSFGGWKNPSRIIRLASVIGYPRTQESSSRIRALLEMGRRTAAKGMTPKSIWGMLE